MDESYRCPLSPCPRDRVPRLPWFESKQDAIIPSEHIPGGYTNNEVLGMTKLDMDKFPDVRAELIKEMTNILQWWCDMRLRHTSTYGVRIYRRDSMCGSLEISLGH